MVIIQKATVMIKKNTNLIPSRLRELRKIQRISQKAVRKITGVDISKYETGERLPKIETLIKLSSFFEVHFNLLQSRISCRKEKILN